MTEENNFYDSIIIAKTVWNEMLEFLHYVTERKMGVILRCKLATHNKWVLKLPHVSLFHIFSAIGFCQILFGLPLKKLFTKIKGVNFYWDQCPRSLNDPHQEAYELSGS